MQCVPYGVELFIYERNDFMSSQNPETQLMEVASRIRDMRELLGYSMQKMAYLTEVSEETYRLYESEVRSPAPAMRE